MTCYHRWKWDSEKHMVHSYILYLVFWGRPLSSNRHPWHSLELLKLLSLAAAPRAQTLDSQPLPFCKGVWLSYDSDQFKILKTLNFQESLNELNCSWVIIQQCKQHTPPPRCTHTCKHLVSMNTYRVHNKVFTYLISMVSSFLFPLSCSISSSSERISPSSSSSSGAFPIVTWLSCAPLVGVVTSPLVINFRTFKEVTAEMDK